MELVVVIIKPLLDAFGILDVKTISFLSGCTVLAMSSYSFIVSQVKKESLLDLKISTSLAIGAALGGVIGKNLFQNMIQSFEQNYVGAILLLVLMGTGGILGGYFGRKKITQIYEFYKREIGFLEESLNVHSDCKECKYGTICRGGCKRYRNPKDYHCKAYYEFFEYSMNRMQEMADYFR